MRDCALTIRGLNNSMGAQISMGYVCYNDFEKFTTVVIAIFNQIYVCNWII